MQRPSTTDHPSSSGSWSKPSKRAGILLAALVLLPARCFAQAEEAPPGSVPAWREYVPPSAPRARVGATVGLAWNLGGATPVAPSLGWAYGLQASASLLRLRALRLGFVIDYAQARFSQNLTGVGQELVHSTFAVQALLDAPLGPQGRFRPFLAGGVGGSVGRFTETPATCGESICQVQTVALVPLVRFTGGIYFAPVRVIDIGVGVDVSVTVSSTRDLVTAIGQQRVLFAPGYTSLWLGVGYRFL